MRKSKKKKSCWRPGIYPQINEVNVGAGIQHQLPSTLMPILTLTDTYSASPEWYWD